MDQAVRAYIDAVDPQHRPLFDRLHRLILDVHPDALLALSYKIPSYRVGRRRIFLAAWEHGVSIYGWGADRDGGFTARHPEFTSGKATIRVRETDAAGVSDDEFRDLIGAALAA